MQEDKYSAIWISHSSLSDFKACPRAYYFANVYKNPKSGRKIALINPWLALGQVVHTVLESLSHLPASERFTTPLAEKFDTEWSAISSRKGGFFSDKQEQDFKERGRAMLAKIEKNPGPLIRKAIKIKDELPHYWFSEDEQIILCGKIDWMEYVEETESVHIIDFKTGKRTESESSLQMPIYYLLASNVQTRPISKTSYWYLDDNNPQDLVEIPLSDAESSEKKIMEVAMRIKLARKLNHFKCAVDEKNGCAHCTPYDLITRGRAEFVGMNLFNREVYVLSDEAKSL